MTKVGKTPDDIFASTATKPNRGRPPLHQEDWTKVTTSLLNRQVVFLDGVSNDIRANSGKVVKRTAIIRALIDALELSDIDLTEVTSEDECRQILLQHLTTTQVIENSTPDTDEEDALA
ncbi:hypothetical protein CMK10_15230 [Candidatus Poribacteria bacterium]|nr:hypothetical protein [Candidatus Poribacteria bacterium]MEC7866908.1 hypothetical protein [Candidatus Poribacteria bacterium]